MTPIGNGLKLSYDNAFATSARSGQLKVLRLVPLALMLAACSSVSVPISPYRIDVQQGNALEQEAVDKLKPGLSRSQVRFLLGTPLLIDPFHGNRWDYVYNFRKAGKLTEQKRLVLFFDGDVLSRIETDGVTINPPPEPKPVEPPKPAVESEGPTKALVAEPPLVAEPLPADAPKTTSPAPAATVAPAQPTAAEPVATQPVPASTEMAPAAPAFAPAAVAPAVVAAPEPAASQPGQESRLQEPAPAVSAGERSLDETSIVRPLRAEPDAAAKASGKPVAVRETRPEPVALQAEVNVAAVKPDTMPEFPSTAVLESQLTAALNAWAEAWRNRNVEAYLAAYAPSFRPSGKESRSEWEKRRRMLLGISRNIDLRIEGVATESISEERAQISFRQFYRSDTYQDAVRKQLSFARIDGKWLIEEEIVLGQVGANR